MANGRPARLLRLLGRWFAFSLFAVVAFAVGYYNTGLLSEIRQLLPTDDQAEHNANSETDAPRLTSDGWWPTTSFMQAPLDTMPDTIQATELRSRSETEVASGRCAPTIVLGVYDWEYCAWSGTRDIQMSKPEMLELIERVWHETDSPGTLPPDLEEDSCGWPPDAPGCYEPVSHAIRIVSGSAENFTLRLLLHELAHALIAGSDEMASCVDDWTHRQSACGHGNLFRCVADDLYVRYAGLDTAGVCGQAPDLDPGGWQLLAPGESEWGVVHSLAQVTDPVSNHTLQIMCATNYEQLDEPERQLVTILFLEHDGRLDALDRWRRQRAAAPDYQVRIRYRFSDEEHLSDSRWLADENLNIALWPEHDASSLARRFQGANRLFLRIEYTQQDIVQAEFDLGHSPALALVQEACEHDS